MQHNSVHRGLLIKLLTDYSNVPGGTWATVDATGTMRDGAWWFTVRWRPYTPIPDTFPRGATEYSTNLWESDLTLFEAVSAEEAANTSNQKAEPSWNPARLPHIGGGGQPRKRVSVHPNQLSLFAPD